MSEALTPGGIAQRPSRRTVLSATAWLVLLVGSGVPTAIGIEVFGVSPPWWLPPAQLLLLAAGLALTTLRRLRPLRAFVLALFVVQAAKFLQFEVLGPRFDTEVGAQIAFVLLQWLFVLAVVAVLVAAGAARERLFLRVGDHSATAEGEWLPGLRRERPWWALGVAFVAVATLATYWYVRFVGFLAADPLARDPGTLAALAPLILFLSASNAFYEEFVYRAAPLAPLVDALGKRHAFVLLAAFFGLTHYQGVPGGIPGVAMTFVLGWFASMVVYETRGLGIAVGIHFALDVLVFSATVL
jgi:membrane protease YdiL (CAAX protease family)